jgi:hypothetical protein
LITRSGTMWTYSFPMGMPGPSSIDASVPTYWDGILQTLGANGGPLTQFGANARFGLAAFTADLSTTKATCAPQVTLVNPALSNADPIATALRAVTRPAKGESPVSLVVRQVTTLLSVDTSPGAKHIVIISNGLPDFCDDGKPECPRDDVVAAVQDAFRAGIQTHVISLGNLYLDHEQDVANAGMGQPVRDPGVTAHSICDSITGQYIAEGGAAGTAPFAVATDSPDQLKQEITTLLGSLVCH